MRRNRVRPAPIRDFPDNLYDDGGDAQEQADYPQQGQQQVEWEVYGTAPRVQFTRNGTGNGNGTEGRQGDNAGGKQSGFDFEDFMGL